MRHRQYVAKIQRIIRDAYEYEQYGRFMIESSPGTYVDAGTGEQFDGENVPRGLITKRNPGIEDE